MTTSMSTKKAALHISDASTIRLIPLDRIRVLNPRVRNKQVFAKLVENIATIGLKRPITVTCTNDGGGERFEVVCGQGESPLVS